MPTLPILTILTILDNESPDDQNPPQGREVSWLLKLTVLIVLMMTRTRVQKLIEIAGDKRQTLCRCRGYDFYIGQIAEDMIFIFWPDYRGCDFYIGQIAEDMMTRP